jgi:adenosylcobinamide kinase/adenosylcobinamide-phosphate guanylyltransferase
MATALGRQSRSMTLEPGNLLDSRQRDSILGRRKGQDLSITLVLGGARSGKSAYAESLILGQAKRALYLATSEALDGEMTDRVRRHRERRDARWETREEPLDLVSVLLGSMQTGRPILVDCLTLWLSNLLHAERDVDAEIAALVAVLPRLAGDVVFVSNEVGLGIVPDNALARAFRDHAGRLHQAIAAVADRVVFVVAGLPMTLKPPPSPGPQP